MEYYKTWYHSQCDNPYYILFATLRLESYFEQLSTYDKMGRDCCQQDMAQDVYHTVSDYRNLAMNEALLENEHHPQLFLALKLWNSSQW